ncbi:MAG TPA: 3'-5' exonuclease [Burkholderiaceae bacterium]|nr:3'-5' exonuclease [Burkholderiaceae bacterium]
MTTRPLPDRDTIAGLPEFARLGVADITAVAAADEAHAAHGVLGTTALLGFDTESRPTFIRGESSEGPHVVQFATSHHAWVFQLNDPICREVVVELLHSPSVVKVGFGLSTDRQRLAAKLGAEPRALIDVDVLFRQRGYRKEVGVKAAVALVFGQRFVKSRRLTTSNWASPRLSPAQLVYAANDAYAAIRVYQALPDVPADPSADVLAGTRGLLP